MVTTDHYSASQYQTNELMYGGVVHVSSGGFYGSGALLYDGRAILTAAHVVEQGVDRRITFLTPEGMSTRRVSEVVTHPSADTLQGNYDLALLWLESSAPVDAERYQLYRDTDEIGQSFTQVGFGSYGVGDTGAIYSSSSYQRLRADNQFEITGEELDSRLSLNWNPVEGIQLLADFDSGNSSNDAFGLLLGMHDLGLGVDEGLVAKGDSGGPAFIDGYVAGVASYVSTVSRYAADPDIDGESNNSSFGEIAAWQRISSVQEWIDQELRNHYLDTPARPEDIAKEVLEGDSATTQTYFMVSYSGIRSEAPDILSVDYATRDGSATAGSDYIAVSGTLHLYSNEDFALIPVEIIGDSLAEPDETFYLDIFNPVGADLVYGAVTLTAYRTILNDDLFG
jgi:hypothetical protein